MADWTQITKNMKTYGHFSGQSKSEQDAYYEFFAGNDLSLRKHSQLSLRSGLGFIKKVIDRSSVVRSSRWVNNVEVDLNR